MAPAVSAVIRYGPNLGHWRYYPAGVSASPKRHRSVIHPRNRGPQRAAV